jgi:DNA polymerase-1
MERGSAAADLLILGLAPGVAEDFQGRPFVGPSGKILDDILTNVMGMSRQEVAVTNTVKCMLPQGKREPSAKELAACRRWLLEDIEAVQPKVIFALGNVAGKALLGPKMPAIVTARLQDHTATFELSNGSLLPVSVQVSYHPSSVLRGGGYIKQLAEDAQRVRKLLDGTAPDRKQRTFDPSQIHIVRGMKEAVACKRAAVRRGYAVLDAETIGLQPYESAVFDHPLHGILCLAVCAGGESWVWPLAHPGALPFRPGLRFLRELLASPHVTKVAHNLKFDMKWLLAGGFSVAPPYECTLVLDALLAGADRPHDLSHLAWEYGYGGYDEALSDLKKAHKVRGKNSHRYDWLPWEALSAYNARDALLTEVLYQDLRQRLGGLEGSAKLEVVYRTMMAATDALLEMEMVGWRANKPTVRVLYRRYARQLHDVASRLAERSFVREFEVGQEKPLNLGSPKQVSALLYDTLGAPSLKRTGSGAKSTDERSLKAIRTGADSDVAAVIDAVLEYRTLSKRLSTYVRPYLAAERIRTTYTMHVARTGRLSSTDPNVQNIPKRGERGAEVRSIFRSDDGCLLASADYSQIELRVMAAYSGEQSMIDAFLAGGDIHAETARTVYGVAEPSDDMRSRAKTVNFAILYGMGAAGLAAQLDMPYEEASAFLYEYKSAFPAIAKWQRGVIARARKTLSLRNRFGRIGRFPDLVSGDEGARAHGERQAVNFPIQSTAADILHLATVRVHAWLAKLRGGKPIATEPWEPRLVGSVHDELIFSFPEKRARAFARIAQRKLTAFQFGWMRGIPLLVDVSIGTTWATLEDMK